GYVRLQSPRASRSTLALHDALPIFGAVHLYQPRAEADKGAPALQVDAGLAALPLLEVHQEFGPGQLHTPSPFVHPHGYTASDSETDWRKGMRMVRNATLSSAGASATGAKGSER